MAKTSILITGANGSLGTLTALNIAKQHPAEFHLILAVRNPADVNSQNLQVALDALGSGVTYSFVALDLLSLASVRAFVAEITRRLDAGDLPPLHALINSAARLAFLPEPYTTDGFHPIYQINYLSPWVLTTGLVGRLVEGQGRVVNVTSASRVTGKMGYYDAEGVGVGSGETKERWAIDALKAYASAKVMMIGFGAELRRRLVKSHPEAAPPAILVFDPGAISGPSRASAFVPLPFRITNFILTILAPIGRLLGTRSLSHGVEAPASAMCDLACGAEFGGGRTGVWFLGDEMADEDGGGEEKTRELWERTVQVLGGEEPRL